jgi:hypothetical protein
MMKGWGEGRKKSSWLPDVKTEKEISPILPLISHVKNKKK